MTTTVALAGSTGSIGTQTIEVVAAEPDRYEIVALGATGRNLDLLADQVAVTGATVVPVVLIERLQSDLGVETVYGVIYPPQVALVGLGRVLARPAVRDGAIVATRTMNATLSGDHRVTDGLTGARFLSALRERFEHPEAP